MVQFAANRAEDLLSAALAAQAMGADGGLAVTERIRMGGGDGWMGGGEMWRVGYSIARITIPYTPWDCLH